MGRTGVVHVHHASEPVVVSQVGGAQVDAAPHRLQSECRRRPAVIPSNLWREIQTTYWRGTRGGRRGPRRRSGRAAATETEVSHAADHPMAAMAAELVTTG